MQRDFTILEMENVPAMTTGDGIFLGKAAYIWISSDLAKAGPTIVVVVLSLLGIWANWCFG